MNYYKSSIDSFNDIDLIIFHCLNKQALVFKHSLKIIITKSNKIIWLILINNLL